eukprot:TRINITY_DN5009_c0_g1_i1.p1 TRINITY_DN5009_c0_g1~~TRINITY_DN5009_c0_g1_i1.p1  ORF type:complete len:369 (+),score=89.22 TRINITY_DN5009_c0_g1_i1:167-1273(+)
MKAVTSTFDDYDWDVTKFVEHRNNKEVYLFDNIAKRLGIEHWEDWYRVRHSEISEYGAVLQNYGFSVKNALMSVYPHLPWKSWRFVSANNVWKEPENRLDFCEYLYKELHLDKWEDWYQVSSEDLARFGGQGLLSHFEGSIPKMLRSVYPSLDWKEYRFQHHRLEEGYWKKSDHQIAFLNDLGEKMKVRNKEDWFRVKFDDFDDFGGRSLLKLYGFSPMRTVMAVYGQTDPEWLNLKRGHSNILTAQDKTPGKSQVRLFHTVEAMFPKEEVFMNFIYVSSDGKRIELDVMLPQLRLAFEYQGLQHYSDKVPILHGKATQRKDKEKREICKRDNITLFEVPYWWNLDGGTLAEKISSERPDLQVHLRTI